MPKTEQQLLMLKEQRKNKIALSALKVFCEKGYDGTTVDDIAKKAKCSHGLFYHYFKSKKEVFNHMLALHRKNAHAELNQELEKEPSFKNKLRIILSHMFHDLIHDENFAYYYFFFVSQSFALKEKGTPPPRKKDPDKKPPILIMEDLFEKGQIAGEFSNKYSPKECARMFISIVQGATLGYVIAPKEIQKKMKLPNCDFIIDIFSKEI